MIVVAAIDDVAGTIGFLRDARGAWWVAGFVLVYALLFAAVVALWSAGGIARHIAWHASIASIAVTTATRALNRAGFGIEEARIFLFENAFAWEALISYPHAYAAGAGLGVLAGAALYTAGNSLLPRNTKAIAATTALLVILATAAAPSMASFVPAPVRVPVALIAAATHRPPSAATPASKPSGNARARHIVVVVDESVRADAFPRLTLPDLADFGQSVAATNCSAPANYVLRTGVRALPASLAPRHTVFDYARAAGFRTLLIDGQSRSRAPRNLMSPREVASLDEHLVVRADKPSIAEDQIDGAVARELRRRLLDSRPSLIWVNKYGAHFHYETSYPDHAAVHRPRLGAREPLRDVVRTRNSYRNAAGWTVSAFFDELGPLPARAVLIYTSDHGQSLPGEGARYAHCVADRVPAQQLSVPLAIVGAPAELRAAAALARDRTSQFQIFPTVLWLLGHETSEDLRDPSPRRPPSIVGDIFGRGRYELVGGE